MVICVRTIVNVSASITVGISAGFAIGGCWGQYQWLLESLSIVVGVRVSGQWCWLWCWHYGRRSLASQLVVTYVHMRILGIRVGSH
jgi:hypothetical protein